MELNKLHQGLTYEQYAAEPGVRSGSLKNMLISPAMYKLKLKEERKETESMRFGRYVHAMLENGPEFLSRLIVEPIFSGRTKDGKESTRSGEALEKKRQWHSDLPPDAIVVDEEQLYTLKMIANNVKDHQILGSTFANGLRETSLWVTDPETGLLLQCRPDLIDQHGFLNDFKTSGRVCRPHIIHNCLFGDDMFYSFQAAFYSYCLRIAGVSKADWASMIFIETVMPWGIQIITLDDKMLNYPHQMMRECLRKVAECESSGKWPGYPEKAVMAKPQDWVMRASNALDEGQYE